MLRPSSKHVKRPVSPSGPVGVSSFPMWLRSSIFSSIGVQTNGLPRPEPNPLRRKGIATFFACLMTYFPIHGLRVPATNSRA